MIQTTFKPANRKLTEAYTLPGLSEREKEVLQLTANGDTMKMIANCLHISTDTVDKHSRNIVTKLKAKNMKHAVAIGIRKKIIR